MRGRDFNFVEIEQGRIRQFHQDIGIATDNLLENNNPHMINLLGDAQEAGIPTFLEAADPNNIEDDDIFVHLDWGVTGRYISTIVYYHLSNNFPDENGNPTNLTPENLDRIHARRGCPLFESIIEQFQTQYTDEQKAAVRNLYDQLEQNRQALILQDEDARELQAIRQQQQQQQQQLVEQGPEPGPPPRGAVKKEGPLR